MSPKPTPLLVLDIDGTVRQGVDDPLGRFVNGPEDVVVFPEAIAMMRAWHRDGGRIIGVSNQGGVALGHQTPDACFAALQETDRQADDLFDLLLACCHHPDAHDPDVARCYCRKPRIGLLVLGVAELRRAHPTEVYPAYLTLVVGDLLSDREFADNAGVDFLDAATWRARAATEGVHP